MGMTVRELLDSAKAVGGWYMNLVGEIRTHNRKDPAGSDCCPIAAVLGCENPMAAHRAMKAGLSENVAISITITADNDKREITFDKTLRDEMEGWCK